MAEYVFGANILENLTTGMYQDSKVIYREYIQNACDQIDKAESQGILRSREVNEKKPDIGDGVINIWLKPEKRYIMIEDNATGIKSSEFSRVLGNIADSDKVMGKDKGFRGIGRLCGLAYCKSLVFTSRWIGEDIVSVMMCDALKMREMINEANFNIRKHTALDVLNATIKFDKRPINESDPEHFFRVELIDVNSENEELFGGKDDDNIEQLIDYLSFIAPVPYQANFMYRKEIYAYTRKIGARLDEYDIRINGVSIYKKYKTHLKTGNGLDDVYGVGFHEFRDEDDSLVAWMWFGKTSFKAAIKEEEISRGLRLRKENIQIGESDTLRDFFTREASKRGNNYFIGEIFSVSKELIPNSQRAYFNETPVRIKFEHMLRDYFNDTLYYVYYDGSDTSSSIKKINAYAEKKAEFEKKDAEGGFLSNDERERERESLKIKKQEAEKATANLNKKMNEGGRSFLASEIANRRMNEVGVLGLEIKPKTKAKISTENNLKTKEKAPDIKPLEIKDVEIKNPYHGKKKLLVDVKFPSYNKSERKFLSETLEKIFLIIQKSTDKKTSENIISRIKEDLK